MRTRWASFTLADTEGTILIGTPTFLRSYLRRCAPEDFASLEVVVAGAEKLPKDLSDAFEERFGVRPVEGYGATECSPLVAVNIPASRAQGAGQVVSKEGTVGRPVPGVVAKVTDLRQWSDFGRGPARHAVDYAAPTSCKAILISQTSHFQGAGRYRLVHDRRCGHARCRWIYHDYRPRKPVFENRW